MISTKGLRECGMLPVNIARAFMSTSSMNSNKSYEVVVLGGGAGGCSTAAKFSSKLGKGKVAVVEPRDMHYYQPMWTLVGGGMKKLNESGRPMSKVLPKKADWLKQSVVAFKPEQNKVILEDGTEVSYEFLVVALGLQLNYHKIKGLSDAFETPGVCSNYSQLYVEKTLQSMLAFKEGNAIFTFPNTPIKCAGAPQKIMYIAEENFRKRGVRDKAVISFNTAIGAIFGVKKYANSLSKIIKERNINVNFHHNLIEVKPDKQEAVFQVLNEENKTVSMNYEMLHVTPPMSAPDVLRNEPKLVDQSGFLNLQKETLQHKIYPNIFGIGDCTNLPTSKTAAAVAGQIGVLRKNLSQVMAGGQVTATYDGYTSCPLVTGYSKCIMAEFNYELEPLETFPIDQGEESRVMFHLKKDLMPDMYWHGLLNGYWEGPKYMRKAFHLGFGK